jgi:hypothetical protein
MRIIRRGQAGRFSPYGSRPPRGSALPHQRAGGREHFSFPIGRAVMADVGACRNCYQPIRRTEQRDDLDPPDGFEWVHDNGPRIRGNPICDVTPIAEPEDEPDV